MSITPDHTNYHKGDEGTFGVMITDFMPGVKNIQAVCRRASATHHHTPSSASKPGFREQHRRNENGYMGGGKASIDGHEVFPSTPCLSADDECSRLRLGSLPRPC